MVGCCYRYRNSKIIYKLKEIDGYKYIFECGHWCTDNVFVDLILVNNQIEIF